MNLILPETKEVGLATSNLKSGIGLFFKENIKNNHSSSKWIVCPETKSEIYVQKKFDNLDGTKKSCCFCFSNIWFPDHLQRQGMFKDILNYSIRKSPWEFICVEIVCNINLANFLLKNNFKVKFGDENILECTKSYYIKLAKSG